MFKSLEKIVSYKVEFNPFIIWVMSLKVTYLNYFLQSESSDFDRTIPDDF